MTLEHFQFARVEALRAEAQSIDAKVTKHRAVFEIRCRWIDLDRPLVDVRKIESLAQAEDEPAHFLDRQQRRRTAAEEDRLRRASAAPHFRFAQNQIDESRHAIGS